MQKKTLKVEENIWDKKSLIRNSFPNKIASLGWHFDYHFMSIKYRKKEELAKNFFMASRLIAFWSSHSFPSFLPFSCRPKKAEKRELLINTNATCVKLLLAVHKTLSFHSVVA